MSYAGMNARAPTIRNDAELPYHLNAAFEQNPAEILHDPGPCLSRACSVWLSVYQVPEAPQEPLMLLQAIPVNAAGYGVVHS